MKSYKEQFGGSVTKALEEVYAKSPNWKDGKFDNLVETTMEFSIQSLPKLLYKQFFETKGREPKTPIPVMPFDNETFLADGGQTRFIWYGHSVVLLRVAGLTILIDPMFGPNASPIAPFATNRFSKNTLSIIDDLPEIDMVLMTHDHYDHLDRDSIKKLLPKVKSYHVALGVGRHLVKWGVSKNKIAEYDWWESFKADQLIITFTPTRHFSGRGLRDRAKSLWGGWSIKRKDEHIWFSGDGGYGEHFKELHRRLGDVDLAFMECGQYNTNWHQIHMYPEESVQASLDVQAKQVVVVHWAGFSLAQHTWKEPIERFLIEAEKHNLKVLTPKIGAVALATSQTEQWFTSLE